MVPTVGTGTSVPSVTVCKDRPYRTYIGSTPSPKFPQITRVINVVELGLPGDVCVGLLSRMVHCGVLD
jgi:uncharacterized NAD-dependent epimerase/dehydratase family protein